MGPSFGSLIAGVGLAQVGAVRDAWCRAKAALLLNSLHVYCLVTRTADGLAQTQPWRWHQSNRAEIDLPVL